MKHSDLQCWFLSQQTQESIWQPNQAFPDEADGHNLVFGVILHQVTQNAAAKRSHDGSLVNFGSNDDSTKYIIRFEAQDHDFWVHKM